MRNYGDDRISIFGLAMDEETDCDADCLPDCEGVTYEVQVNTVALPDPAAICVNYVKYIIPLNRLKIIYGND